MQKVGVDSKPHHITDFRNFFEIMIGILVLRHFEQMCITYLPFITRENWKKSPKINKIETWPKLRPKVMSSPNQSHRDHFWGMFEL